MEIVKALRPKQWIKNFIIFFAFIGDKNFILNDFINLTYIFFGFSMVVSSTYIINDLYDKKSDQEHPVKKYRGIAANKISFQEAIISILLLMAFGLYIIYMVKNEALLITFFYILISLFYTAKLKYLKYLDLASIVILFLIRLILGSMVIQINLSTSLILFVTFTCLGIVLGKKISIYKDTEIVISKVKIFLIQNYSLIFLENLMRVSLFLSTITYINWALGMPSSLGLELKIIFLFFSCILYALLMILFSNKTVRGETEDISENLLRIDKFSIVAFLFGVSFLLGSF